MSSRRLRRIFQDPVGYWRFQKRHLLAHKMGVVDQNYISATSDSSAVVGRKIQIPSAEIRALVSPLQAIGEELFDSLMKKP